MEAACSRSELDRATVRPNLENAAAIIAVICDAIFLTKLVKRKNVSNATGVRIDWCGFERGLLRGIQRAFVAVYSNRGCFACRMFVTCSGRENK